ncbi:MAG: phosphatidylcholine synthase [Rhizobiales bacterium]|nr:phosphatidylcholine synthase [Hyphomicrobiales bacterium]
MNLAVTPSHIPAFAVHVLTASGAALGLLALIAAARGAWAWMFLWLGVALIVDGADGVLARRFKVADMLPRWSGDALDLVVDFTTYVFVPAFAIVASGLLPPAAGVVVGMAIVVSAALYFADREMKMPGDYFRGFPGLWNAAAFYLFLLKPEPWIGALTLIVLVGLTFAPFRFIHPVRVRRWRNLNLALLAIWSFLALLAVLRDLDPGRWITAGLCVIGLYFFAFGVLLPRRQTDQDDA